MTPIRGRVRRAGWRRVGHGLHRPGDPGSDSQLGDLASWMTVLPDGAKFTHLTAARLYGLWLPPIPVDLPVFVSLPRGANRVRRPEIQAFRVDPVGHRDRSAESPSSARRNCCCRARVTWAYSISSCWGTACSTEGGRISIDSPPRRRDIGPEHRFCAPRWRGCRGVLNRPGSRCCECSIARRASRSFPSMSYGMRRIASSPAATCGCPAPGCCTSTTVPDIAIGPRTCGTSTVTGDSSRQAGRGGRIPRGR